MNWLLVFGDILMLVIVLLWNLYLLEEGKSIGKVKDKEDIIME